MSRHQNLRIETLSPKEAAEMTESATQTLGDHPSGWSVEQAATAVRRALPKRLSESVAEWLTQPHGAAWVLDNVPVAHDLGPTPPSIEVARDVRGADFGELLSMGFSRLMGEPYMLTVEGDQVVSHLVPLPSHANTLTGLGGDRELSLHIENGALRVSYEMDRSPLALTLLGQRGDPYFRPLTYVADARLALSQLSAADRDALFLPEAQIRVPYRHVEAMGGMEWTNATPVLFHKSGRLVMAAAFYEGMMTARTQRMSRALAALECALDHVKVGIDVRPGRFVAIDNRMGLHARDAFVPSYGTRARWLMRCFVTDDLGHFETWATDRPRIFAPRPDAI